MSDFISTKYLLMNNTVRILEFDIESGEILHKYSDILPYGFTSIFDWINLRLKFSCARDTEKFFKSIGMENAEDLIESTHCVSLSDTFWIKRKDSRLTWDKVSPFMNAYSNVVSVYSLEGIILDSENENYYSPDISTDGSFPHTWKYSGVDNISFIKAGSKYTLGGINSGKEPYSEYFASQIAQYLGFNCVKYAIRQHTRYDGKVDIVTECKCFTTEQIGSVTAHNLGLHSYEAVLEYCKNLSDKAYHTCLDMLFLDCLLLNTDRHFANIEFLVNNDTLKVIDIAPIFDNNNALLPRFVEEYDEFIRTEYIARDDRPFNALYKLVKRHKSYHNELIRLRKYRITKPNSKGVEISESRLIFLNELLQTQINYLLRNE